jgi:hypothetical protein
MSAHKEPHFWSSDIPRSLRVADKADYEAQWAHARPGALRGEASPDYLRSQVAIPSLLSARPDIRLIAMIRNPVELAASLHSVLLTSAQEDIPDFETAWRLQASRREGRNLPRTCFEPVLLQYAAYASLGDQLDRFFALVPAEQRLVIVHDDFRVDPRAEYRRVLDWLGLPDDGRADFAPLSPNRAVRSAGLMRFCRSLPRRLGPLYAPAQAAAHALGMHPMALVERLNLALAPRKPLRKDFEAELIAHFLPQVEKVETLLGRELASWKSLTSGT